MSDFGRRLKPFVKTLARNLTPRTVQGMKRVGSRLIHEGGNLLTNLALRGRGFSGRRVGDREEEGEEEDEEEEIMEVDKNVGHSKGRTIPFQTAPKRDRLTLGRKKKKKEKIKKKKKKKAKKIKKKKKAKKKRIKKKTKKIKKKKTKKKKKNSIFDQL